MAFFLHLCFVFWRKFCYIWNLKIEKIKIMAPEGPHYKAWMADCFPGVEVEVQECTKRHKHRWSWCRLCLLFVFCFLINYLNVQEHILLTKDIPLLGNSWLANHSTQNRQLTTRKFHSTCFVTPGDSTSLFIANASNFLNLQFLFSKYQCVTVQRQHNCSYCNCKCSGILNFGAPEDVIFDETHRAEPFGDIIM